MLLLAISILPVIVLMIYIYRKDKYEKEPLGLLVKAFGCGILSALAVIIVLLPLGEPQLFGDFFQSIFTSFFFAAIPEEIAKFVFLYLLIWNNKNFNEYFDGIVYAVFVSLGFACFENIIYVFGNGVEVGISRALFSVPAHFLFAVIMGYYFSIAKFSGQSKRKNLLLGVLLAILAHGTFNTILFWIDSLNEISESLASVFTLLFYAFDIYLWRIGLKRIKKHISKSEYKSIFPSSDNQNY